MTTLNQTPSITVVVLGDAHVGKTELIRRLTGQEQATEYHATVGADCTSVMVQHSTAAGSQPMEVELRLWDFPGNERFILPFGVPTVQADVCVIVADCCSRESLETSAELWYDEYVSTCAQRLAPPAIVLALNKVDIPSDEQRVVGTGDAAGWCGRHRVDPGLWLSDVVGDRLQIPPLVEVSARTNVGIPALTSAIVDRGLVNEALENALRSKDRSRGLADYYKHARNGAIRCVVLGDVEQPELDRITYNCVSLVTQRATPRDEAGASDDANPQDFDILTIPKDTARCGLAISSGASASPAPPQHAAQDDPNASVEVAATPNPQNRDVYSMLVWRAAGLEYSGSPFFRGAHLGVLCVRTHLSFDSEQLSKNIEIFYREALLRSPSTPALVVLGIRSGQHNNDGAMALAQFCSRKGLVSFDIPETASESFLSDVWCHIAEVAATLRDDLIVQRTAGQMENFLTPCDIGGCDWKGCAKDALSHSRSCPFGVITCRFEGCGLELHRKDREEHEKFCAKRPFTCHFCDVPYEGHLYQHLAVCSKRSTFEDGVAHCPLHEFGCPAQYLRRGDVRAHLESNMPAHVELLCQGVNYLKRETGNVEMSTKRQLLEHAAAQEAENEKLREELKAARFVMGQQAETIKEVQLEMHLLWEELQKKQDKPTMDDY